MLEDPKPWEKPEDCRKPYSMHAGEALREAEKIMAAREPCSAPPIEPDEMFQLARAARAARAMEDAKIVEPRPLEVGDVVRLKCDDGAYPTKMVVEQIDLADSFLQVCCAWLKKNRKATNGWFALTSLVRVDDGAE